MVKVCMNGYKPTLLVWGGVILKCAGKLTKPMPLTTIAECRHKAGIHVVFDVPVCRTLCVPARSGGGAVGQNTGTAVAAIFL